MTPYEIAHDEYGVKEISGRQDNPQVLKYFDDIGFDGSELKDETAWCSAFVNWCCIKTGYRRSGALNARSWLNVGCEVATDEQQKGDIVIFWRESPDSWKGHVAFYVTKRSGWVYVLGGNQGNQVKISAYPESRVLQYRQLQRETL